MLGLIEAGSINGAVTGFRLFERQRSNQAGNAAVRAICQSEAALKSICCILTTERKR